jgi:diguanylate cyclase (GGDEF)-like protein
LLPELNSKEEAKMIAERICVSLKQPWKLKNNTFQTFLSIGVALYPQDGTSVTTLLNNADQALYKAKNKGRDKYNSMSFKIVKIIKGNIANFRNDKVVKFD